MYKVTENTDIEELFSIRVSICGFIFFQNLSRLMFSHNYENNELICTLTVLDYVFSNSAITGIQEHLYCITEFLTCTGFIFIQ